MGLAASQCRLLMLTYRKDSLEGKLMLIANEKLALSRQSANLSKAYNKALDAKSLTWKTDQGTTDLTYGLLMKSNLENDSGQYIVTNAHNDRMILDDSYIAKLGISKTGNPGDIASMTKQQFIMLMIGSTAASADAYVADIAPDSSTIAASSNSFTISYDDNEVIQNSGLTVVNASEPSVSEEPAAAFESLLQEVSSRLGTELKTQLLTSLGSEKEDELDAALADAYKKTLTKFIYNTTDGSMPGSGLSMIDGSCTNTNRISSKDGGKVDGDQIIKTFLTSFDKYCQENYGGTTSTSFIGPDTTFRADSGTGTTTDYIATGGTGTTTSDLADLAASNTAYTIDIDNNGISDLYDAAFYINIYDALNKFGWQTDSDINTEGYMENQILNGNMSLKQYQETDGSWETTSTSDPDCPMTKATDEEAIVKAEAEYNAGKDLLEEKDKGLDFKKLIYDTERSSIVEETESVEAIIKKNIERSFKMFDA